MFFKKRDKVSSAIYQNIVQISRSKFHYLDLKLKDNFETRFDLIIFHSFIIFSYYKDLNNKKSEIPQNLFDLMFSDFENNLREMGFGDIAVNKKMKVFISAFYGRIAQYSKGIEYYQTKKDKSLLHKAILNNIYKNNQETDRFINYFINFMIINIENFSKNNEIDNIKNNFQYINIKF